jgi:hypothetical protein
MQVKVVGLGMMLLGTPLGCQRASEAGDAKRPGQSLPSPKTALARQQEPVPRSECAEPSFPRTTLRDASGPPTVTLHHPSTWRVVRSAPNRLELTPEEPSFQVIVSVLSGPTYDAAQVRQLDDASLGRFPLLRPWRKVEGPPGLVIFTATRDLQPNIFEVRYYAGTGGLVVVSIESFDALPPDASRQWESFLRCLGISFR